MPALSFSGEPERGPFWKLIISGEKEQTVRKPRKRPIKEGDLLKLYWKQRVPQDQKPIHYIGSAICTQIETLPKYAFMHSEAFARKDGFEDEGELEKLLLGVVTFIEGNVIDFEDETELLVDGMKTEETPPLRVDNQQTFVPL